MDTAEQKANQFLQEEGAFRLGALQTEASHPGTRTLSQTLATDVAAGIRLLQTVDLDIVSALERLFGQADYARLVDVLTQTLQQGGRLFFTGCGATGRLSILLEAAWRAFWQSRSDETGTARWGDRCVSVMAGGDYALIKSVEGFEDFADFGRRQLRDAGVQAHDVVVAITEGGETPFVIGTAWEGLAAGAEVFFVYNNPTDLLREHVTRSREILDEPRIGKLDLATGPMAITGSTRMQATTAELLVVGAALEQALGRLLHEDVADSRDVAAYQMGFRRLIEDLMKPEVVTSLAAATLYEADLYRQQGRVTYLAQWGLLDILTDTTERSPTFMVPAFRAWDDTQSPPSWAFVCDPTRDTEAAWRDLLCRIPRGLTWDREVYRNLQAPASLQACPPHLDNAALYRFRIGCEPDPDRIRGEHAAGIAIHCDKEVVPDTVTILQDALQTYPQHAWLTIGAPGPWQMNRGADSFHCPCHLPESPLQLWRHLALKLVLNTLSTATMTCLGRVLGNAMIWVSPSNKKLIDRGCRLIAQATGCSYTEACVALHQQMAPSNASQGIRSPVAATIASLGYADDIRNASHCQ